MTTTKSLLRIRVFDGARQELDASSPALITISDGNHQVLFRSEKPSGTIFEVPFYDNAGDNYTVIAYRQGYEQAGFTPVQCSPKMQQSVDLMLLKTESSFHFAQAKWETLGAWNADALALLKSGVEEAVARARYEDLMESQPAVLACFFNLTTAMAAIYLAQGTPLSYFKQMIWDGSFAQDRFFAYADTALYQQVLAAAQRHEFEREPGFALFHPGATDSYKQIQFGEANVQLTFHANDPKTIDGVQTIKVEPDIDYYKDMLSHALLELVVNGFTQSLTDPRQVYLLRWIAGRHAGVAEFNPPYTIE